MTLDEDIVSWHKQTFPDITMGELLLKLEEELRELLRAKIDGDDNAVNEERADVYIVSCALYYRFMSRIGFHFMRIIENIQYGFNKDAVKDKLSKNKKRKWHKVNGIYRHKDDE